MATRRAEIRNSRQQSRERIIAAATELVRDRPFAALTVDEIMTAAGFGRTIFYRHFDDLAELVMRAGSEAIEELYEAQCAFSAARIGGGPEVVCEAIEPAVAVYVRHGPLLRAIDEAAAGDDQVAVGRSAMRRRFDDLAAEALASMPHVAGRQETEIAETARALNLMNESYLLDAFGREPRVSSETAVRTLTQIWVGAIQGLAHAPRPTVSPSGDA